MPLADISEPRTPTGASRACEDATFNEITVEQKQLCAEVLQPQQPCQ
jgi:hypothetical protein